MKQNSKSNLCFFNEVCNFQLAVNSIINKDVRELHELLKIVATHVQLLLVESNKSLKNNQGRKLGKIMNVLNETNCGKVIYLEQ